MQRSSVSDWVRGPGFLCPASVWVCNFLLKPGPLSSINGGSVSCFCQGVGSMVLAGAALTFEYVLLGVLLFMPVSCQNFRVFFDVSSGS